MEELDLFQFHNNRYSVYYEIEVQHIISRVLKVQKTEYADVR